MVNVDVPGGNEDQSLVAPAEWARFSPAAQAVIVRLAQQVVALTAEVRALQARVGQDSSNSSRPPSSDPPWGRGRKRRPPPEVTGRRPGGQPGHTGHFRALAPTARVDAIVDHWPAQCAGCAAVLAIGIGTGMPVPVPVLAAPDYVAHQVTELPELRATITEHRQHTVVCATCGVTTRATLPADVPTSASGPRLQAAVATLSGAYRLSRRQVADLCHTLLDAPLSVGSIDALCQATSTALAAPVAAAVATLPAAPVVNADETSWKQGKARPWLWVAVTALVTVFQIATSRRAQVIKDLLGTGYRGTLGTDRYSGYAWLDVAFRQVCWAHLARDFQALIDRGGTAAPLGTAALALVRQLFTAWHQFRQGTLDRAGLQTALAPVNQALHALLLAGQRTPDATAAGLCRSLLRLWPALWNFAEDEGVEPTNNAAERALRPAVLWRKSSGGTQSDDGARCAERLLTVTATCRQHGHSVFAYLTDVCVAAQRGLPAPSLLTVAA